MSDRKQNALEGLLEGLPAPAQHRPVGDWQPALSGVIDIRIDASGHWFHDGDPIKRPALVKLFASILRREADGFYLVTPGEKQRIQVDDAPLFVNQLRHEGEGQQQRLVLITRTDDVVALDADHPLWVVDSETAPAPYVRVRDQLDARIGRNVFYQLVELAVSHTVAGVERFGVWSDGGFFPLDGGAEWSS